MKRKNLVLCLGFYILNVLKHYMGLFQTNKQTNKQTALKTTDDDDFFSTTFDVLLLLLYLA